MSTNILWLRWLLSDDTNAKLLYRMVFCDFDEKKDIATIYIERDTMKETRTYMR